MLPNMEEIFIPPDIVAQRSDAVIRLAEAMAVTKDPGAYQVLAQTALKVMWSLNFSPPPEEKPKATLVPGNDNVFRGPFPPKPNDKE